jgi:hypothetical protein
LGRKLGGKMQYVTMPWDKVGLPQQYLVYGVADRVMVWTLDRTFAEVLESHTYGQQVLNGYGSVLL